MRMDKPFLRGLFTFAASLFFGLVFADCEHLLDAFAGRTLLTAFYSRIISTLFALTGFLLVGYLHQRIVRPSRWIVATVPVAALWLLLTKFGIGRLDFEWGKLLVDSTRSASGVSSLLTVSSLLFFALPMFLFGAMVRLTLLAILHTRKLGSRTAFALMVGLGVIPFVLAVAILPRADIFGSVRSEGVFARLVHRDAGFARGSAVWQGSSSRHTFSVYRDPDYGLVYCQDGRPKLFSLRFHASRTLSGMLPMMLNPSAKEVAVLGGDAGFAVPFVFRCGASRIEYDDVDESALRLAIAAEDVINRGDAAAEGAPCEKILHRGVSLSDKKYDCIYLTPEPIWIRGAPTLTSVGFYLNCHRALNENGLLSLHLDARALPVGRFVAIARAFITAFPETQVWSIGMNDWMLIGSKAPMNVPADEMYALFDSDRPSRDLIRAGILSIPDLLPSFLCRADGIAAWLERTESCGALRSAMQLPALVLREEGFSLRPNQLEGCRQRSFSWLTMGGMDSDIYYAIRRRTESNVDARALAVRALAEIDGRNPSLGLQAARDAARLNPRDIVLLDFASSLDLEGRRRAALGDFDGALTCYENMLSFDPSGARAHYGMGYCLRAKGSNLEAFRHFARAVNAQPAQALYRMELAQVAGVLADFDEADRQYLQVLRIDPNNPEIYFRYAKILADRRREKPQYEDALLYAEKACAMTKWQNSEFAYGLADLYIEAGKTLEGLGLKRRLKNSTFSGGEAQR